MRKVTVVLALSIVLVAMIMALQAGAVRISGEAWLDLLAVGRTYLGHAYLSSQAGGLPLDATSYVLWYLRIPRVLLAVVVGGSLGLSGALVQGLFRNPLADTGLLGVTTGAACAAALTIVLVSEQALVLSPEARLWLLPVVSFTGAFMTCLFLNVGAKWLLSGSIAGLLLLGIALNALGVAVIGICTYLATDEQLRSLTFWTLGSLAGATWSMVFLVGFVLVVVYLWSRRLASRLNALTLGDTTAAHLGVVVDKLRWSISLQVAMLTGLSVAFCGVIGFVGLMAPHLARAVIGADQRTLLPVSIFFGVLLMLVADTLARTVVIPAEIPIGIFTALLGGPFLVVLLRAKRQQIG